MNRIVAGLIGVTLMGFATISYADGVLVPGSIKIASFKKEMKKRGMDLYGRDDSDGAIENGGTQIKIITYKPVTPEQLDLIKDVSYKNAR